MTRQAMPDIISSLMGDRTEVDISETMKDERNNAVFQESNKAIITESNKAVKKSVKVSLKPKQMMIDGSYEGEVVEEEEAKEKATFNLPVKLLSELEDRWMEIRKLSGSKQISKTLIVEEALRMAFSEYDLKKQYSKFYGKLESSKALKQ